MFQNAFDGIAKNVEKQNPQQPDDYVKDGLLYCGKCHTPKQVMIRQPRVKGFEQGFKPMPVICECRAKALEEERKAKEAYDRRLYRLRVLGKVGAAHTFELDDRAEEYATRVCYGYAHGFKELETARIPPIPSDGLLLCGNPGTGKTFLCHAILNAVADKGYTIMAVTVGQFERKMWSGDKGEIFQAIERTDLLLLDDLGAERGSPYVQQLVFDLLDTRVGARKPLLITTNMTKEQILKPETAESRRITSRVLGAVSIVALTGKDRRARDFAAQAQERADKYNEIGKQIEMQDGVPF